MSAREFCAEPGCYFPPHEGDWHMRGTDDLPERCWWCQRGECRVMNLRTGKRQWCPEGYVSFQTTGPKGGIVLFSAPCKCDCRGTSAERPVERVVVAGGVL